jgi:hypothetical protein
MELVKKDYNISKEMIEQLPVPFDDFYRDLLPPQLEENKEFYGPCGKEHYRLLAYLSTLFNGTSVIEIGTHQGKSAIALSYNPNNIVHTFDIEKKYVPEVDTVSNIRFHLENLFDRDVFMSWSQTILSCPFLFIDVDPNNGNMEAHMFQLLQEIGYSGFVVWDDIWYFKEMRNNFWYEIPDRQRYDLTLLGHWSGTGVTVFDPSISFNKKKTDDWTLVTAYFDLTRFDDATAEIKERNVDHYFSNARSTMALPYNLVVYCEQQHLEKLSSMRPAYLRNRVQYHVVDFDELYFRKDHSTEENKDPGFNFAKYREVIKANRKIRPTVDNRNTPSYYLLCMARYVMMKRTIDENLFSSTHFGWINMCIERMGYSNLVHLDEALGVHRNKFSTCYIDYIPEQVINNLGEYFRSGGRCSMCSGFFTGNEYYMWTVADLIENQFIEYLRAGYGHADEQLYSPVYFKNPNLFQQYYGDYQQMITNYVWVYEAPSCPILHFIRNSFDWRNFSKCYDACQVVWESYCAGKCELSFNDKIWLWYYYMLSHKECLTH